MLSVWLVLLSIILYGSVHVKNDKISLFLWLNSTPLYIYHVIFIHWSLDRHLGYFYILAIINSATMNIVVHVSFQINMFTFFGYIPRTGIAGSYDNFIFLFFWGNLCTVFHSGCTKLHSQQQHTKVPFISLFSSTFVVYGLLMLAILSGVR